VTKKKLIPVILVIAVISIASALFLPGDRKKIENTLKKGAHAICNESTSKTMSLVSREYTDTYGFTYEALRKVFFRMFFQIDSIEIHYSIIEIAIKDKRSTVLIDIFVTGMMAGSRQNIIGKKNSPTLLKLTFVKQRFKWCVIESEWQNPQFFEDVFGFPYNITSM
jgi:hypothetical protein